MPQLRVQALVLLHSFRRARLSRQDAAGRRREPHFRPLPKKQPGRRSEGGTRAGKGREEEGKVPPFQAKSQRLPENHSLSQSLPLLAKSPREGREPPLSLTHTHLFFSSPRAATAALEDYRHRRGRRPSKRKRNLSLVQSEEHKSVAWCGWLRCLSSANAQSKSLSCPGAERPGCCRLGRRRHRWSRSIRGGAASDPEVLRTRLAPRSKRPGRRPPADPPGAGEGCQEHARRRFCCCGCYYHVYDAEAGRGASWNSCSRLAGQGGRTGEARASLCLVLWYAFACSLRLVASSPPLPSVSARFRLAAATPKFVLGVLTPHEWCSSKKL